jgi:hypothetical protein
MVLVHPRVSSSLYKYKSLLSVTRWRGGRKERVQRLTFFWLRLPKNSLSRKNININLEWGPIIYNSLDQDLKSNLQYLTCIPPGAGSRVLNPSPLYVWKYGVGQGQGGLEIERHNFWAWFWVERRSLNIKLKLWTMLEFPSATLTTGQNS